MFFSIGWVGFYLSLPACRMTLGPSYMDRLDLALPALLLSSVHLVVALYFDMCDFFLWHCFCHIICAMGLLNGRLASEVAMSFAGGGFNIVLTPIPSTLAHPRQ